MYDFRVLTLFASTVVLCMVYGVINPFLPLLAERKHLELWQTGIVFAAHPLVGMAASLVIGSLLDKVGRRNAVLVAFEVAAVGMLLLGLSAFMGEVPFFITNIVARGLTGIAVTLIFTDGTLYAVMAILASDYPEKAFQYIGVNETSAGIGLLLGPLMGAGLYMICGFAGTFCIASGAYFVSGLVIFRLLGPDRPYEVVAKSEHIFSLLLRPRVFVALFPMLFGLASLAAQELFISIHLEHHGLSTPWIAVSFAITGVIYLAASLAVSGTMGNLNKKTVSAVGACIAVAAMAIVGPWPTVLPDHLALILIGFALMPIGASIVLVECLPLLIEVATQDLGLPKDDKLIDKLSAIMSFGMLLGQLVGPLYQGFLTAGVGVRDTCGGLAGVGAAMTLAFIAIMSFRPLQSYTPLPQAEEQEKP